MKNLLLYVNVSVFPCPALEIFQIIKFVFTVRAELAELRESSRRDLLFTAHIFVFPPYTIILFPMHVLPYKIK